MVGDLVTLVVPENGANSVLPSLHCYMNVNFLPGYSRLKIVAFDRWKSLSKLLSLRTEIASSKS